MLSTGEHIDKNTLVAILWGRLVRWREGVGEAINLNLPSPKITQGIAGVLKISAKCGLVKAKRGEKSGWGWS